jgi:hypothetical protein
VHQPHGHSCTVCFTVMVQFIDRSCYVTSYSKDSHHFFPVGVLLSANSSILFLLYSLNSVTFMTTGVQCVPCCYLIVFGL